jgi:hypothetical protein
MSRKEQFLAKAAEISVLIERCDDLMSKHALAVAAQSWRMLAAMEDAEGPPTRWPILPRSAP